MQDVKTDEFAKELVDSVKRIDKERTYNDVGIAFEHWSVVNILNKNDDGYLEDIIKNNRTGDRGIDHFDVDHETKTIVILQSKFSEKLERRINDSDLTTFFATPERLRSSKVGNKVFKECQKKYNDALANGFKTVLIFVLAGNFSVTNLDEIERLKNNLDSDSITFIYYDKKGILTLIGNPVSATCTIKITNDEIFESKSGKKIKKVVATIHVGEFKKICKKITPMVLFSLNPRYYLGIKKISKGIIETLRCTPERFWHYNNGISAVCNEFKYNKKNNELEIKNLKIVNGCQTVETIYDYNDQIHEDATILLRLSEVDDDDFRKKISANTNIQNPIKTSDLYSSDPELHRLEESFKDFEFFWERKRGSFRDLNKDKKEKYLKNEKLYVLDKITAARFKLAFKLESPHLSLQLGENKIFSEDMIETPIGVIKIFSKIYKNSSPLDFIIPKILDYLLNNIYSKKENKLMYELLKSAILKYYIIGMIGKIFSNIDDDKRKQIEEKIYKMACDENSTELDNLKIKLKLLVESILSVISHELSSNVETFELSEKSLTILRDKLIKIPLKKIYEERQYILKVGTQKDSFVDYLMKLIEK